MPNFIYIKYTVNASWKLWNMEHLSNQNDVFDLQAFILGNENAFFKISLFSQLMFFPINRSLTKIVCVCVCAHVKYRCLYIYLQVNPPSTDVATARWGRPQYLMTIWLLFDRKMAISSIPFEELWPIHIGKGHIFISITSVDSNYLSW